MKILLSTCCFKHLHASSIIRKMEGFDGLELMVPTPDWKIDYSFIGKVESVHEPYYYKSLFKYGMYTLKPVSIEKKNFIAGVNVAHNMGVKKLVVHPISALLMKKQASKKTAKLLKKYRSRDIEIFVENLEKKHFGKDFSINISPFKSMREWFECGDEPDFNLCLDVVHCLSFNEDPVEIYELYKDRIKHIHLADYQRGKPHLNLGEGILDLKGFFRALKKGKYEGNVVLELKNGAGELIKHNLEMIKLAKK